jgi:hypothetical protein
MDKCFRATRPFLFLNRFSVLGKLEDLGKVHFVIIQANFH